MRAVVLAGGEGTRLRPFTISLPKALVPVGDRPILDIILTQLKKAGVTQVTMAVSHMAHLIMAYCGDGQRLGFRIDYSREEVPLSTIGPLKLIPDLPEVFLVMNSDVLTDLNYRELYETHLEQDNDITVAVCKRNVESEFGVLRTSPETHRIIGFEEKPAYSLVVSMGVYVISRRLLHIVPDKQPFGFDDLMLACIKQGRKAVAYPHGGYWLDIGRPSDYETAIATLDQLPETSDLQQENPT